MSKVGIRVCLVILWIAVVFTTLFVLQAVYDKEKSFSLFVLMLILSNLAYDGLKAVFTFDPASNSDGWSVVKYALGFVFSLLLSAGSLLLAAWLHHAFGVGDVPAQIIGGVGFFGFYFCGMFLLSSAERRFKLSNRQ
ncbi:hypothetical protein [Hydrocarboniphaga effusa]|uniref:hypothetical protein n=1 Tax=Hydrocarboniphaga effusa TaxID=243629 RepID=UPI003BAD2754